MLGLAWKGGERKPVYLEPLAAQADALRTIVPITSSACNFSARNMLDPTKDTIGLKALRHTICLRRLTFVRQANHSERDMYPIQMQVGNRGIGMGYEQFVETFQAVCVEHRQNGRARVFAFVFYDMSHGVVRDALHQAQGFQRLHEKTGKDVTVFYLHDKAVDAHWRNFNLEFMAALGIENQAKTPCIVFFRVENGDIEDVSIYAIDGDSTDPVLTVAELAQYVDEAVNILNAEGNVSALTSLGTAAVKFAGLLRLADVVSRLTGILR